MRLAHLGPDRVHRVGQRVGQADRAEVLATRVGQRDAADSPRRRAVDHRLRVVLAGVQGRGRGDHLERGAGRVAGLRRAVEQRLVVVGAQPREVLRHLVGVVLGHADHDPYPAGLRLHRHDRALAPAQRPQRGALTVRVQRGGHVLALAVLALQLAEDRAELALLAGQRGVARALQADPALGHERVADGVREQPPGRIGAPVDAVVARAAAHAARQHLAVGGLDQPARDLLLLDQRAAVLLVVLQRLGAEHRPLRREADQDGEQDHRQREQLRDLLVHTRPPWRCSRSRRAWSDTISSRASSIMLATIELPP